ncbi:hypothetical protein H4R18_003240 [Coemansia javaensis]|uniref:Arrestin C-terminal-like domain-containing protein n=1 Tax=Coemansia javaensis TaxID=2761396 RepID=A0A9W8HAZ0_9FUNG|nr:hypothetical protein H4R18_003240 [Coemansia javaensis]
MAKGNWLELDLDQPDIVLRGMADDSPGTVFSGRLIAHLCEPIRVKSLTMVLEGHERLEWEYHNNGAISTFHRQTTPLAHTWTFSAPAPAPAGGGRRAEAWPAGRHEFPFSLVFPGNLPESISIPYASVGYHLRATLRRTGIMHNSIAIQREVQVKRDLAFDGGFGAGAIDVENRWREMMEFRIAADADTFAPGDRMRARFMFQPLVKRMRLTKVGVVLKEYVRCHKPTGHAEKTVSRIAALAEVVPGRPGEARASRPGADPLPGVDLTDTLEESIQLTVPAEGRRLQYDHISSYVEITHKLKFSIHFQDPDRKPHTLWISVPVSVVPVLAGDCARAGGCELPTYQSAALDERIVVAGIEQSPPEYDSVVASSSASMHSRDAATIGPDASSANSSCSASVCEDQDGTEVEENDEDRALRRPTPHASPLPTPAGSPQLKSTDDDMAGLFRPLPPPPPPAAVAFPSR